MLCLTTFLFALSAVESGHNDDAIGKNGERSRYQIGEAVWKEHNKFADYEECYGLYGEVVATIHIAKIRRVLKTEDPLIIASAWNQGIAGHRKRGPNDHAKRVSRLYHAIMQEQAGYNQPCP